VTSHNAKNAIERIQRHHLLRKQRKNGEKGPETGCLHLQRKMPQRPYLHPNQNKKRSKESIANNKKEIKKTTNQWQKDLS